MALIKRRLDGRSQAGQDTDELSQLSEPTQHKHHSTEQVMEKTSAVENAATTTKLVICALGIFVSYMIFGIALEKITRGSYGEDGEKFKFPTVLVLWGEVQ